MDDALVKQVAQGTGLSEERIEKILNRWIQDTGKSPQNISVEDFREVLVEVLQNLFTEVVDGENDFIQLSR